GRVILEQDDLHAVGQRGRRVIELRRPYRGVGRRGQQQDGGGERQALGGAHGTSIIAAFRSPRGRRAAFADRRRSSSIPAGGETPPTTSASRGCRSPDSR